MSTISRAETLIKLNQLQRPSSLAAQAILGLGLRLVGQPDDDQTQARFKAGRTFLGLLETDIIRASHPQQTKQEDLFYQPAEVIPPGGKKVTTTINQTRDALGLISGQQAPTEIIVTTINDLLDLSQRYEQAFGDALGEYKWGSPILGTRRKR